MVNFKQMPPVDQAKRVEKLRTLKRLQNGARFEFHNLEQDFRITGRYLDYVGEWCNNTWDKFGRVADRRFAEMDIDWTSV